MPKFRRFRDKDIKGNALHRWLKFFDATLSDDEVKELMDMDSAIKRAEAKLEYLSSDKLTIDLYRAREDSLHERANMISSAKAEGKLEGKLEEKLEIAKKLYSSGMEIETISNLTEISASELKRVLKIQ